MFAGIRRIVTGLAMVVLAGPSLMWPAAVGAANTMVSSQVCPQSFASTTLSTSEPTPTTNTLAAVDGTAQPDAAVDITVNGVSRATLTAAGDGTFAATVPLVIGDNTIVATASDGAFCGNSSSSPAVMIHRDQVPPPAPQITAPASGAVTTASSVLVQGSAEVASQLEVLVNGSVAASLTIGGGGTFSVTVPLVMGSNSITARATNPAGTGPSSVAVTVTRQPAPIQPAPATPAPVVAPSSPTATPEITSPSSDMTTTAASINLAFRGTAGATATVTVNGTQAASVKVGADGTAEVSVALGLGDNVIAVTIGGKTSAPVTVRRTVAPLTKPVITSPEDGFVTKVANVRVVGRADPGARVGLYVGTDRQAEVTADETGAFAVGVNVRAGLNLIYAQVAGEDGVVVRSESIQVNYETGSSGAARAGQNWLKMLVTVPLAAVILTAQVVGDVLGAIVASPMAVVLVMGFSFVATTASRGLLGLETLLLAPGFLRLIKLGRRGAALQGRVVDTVTGRPLRAWVTADAGRPIHAMSGRDGAFAVPGVGPDAGLRATRPGHRMVAIDRAAGNGLELGMEPVAASHSPLAVMGDVVLGTLSWAGIVLAAALGVRMVVQSPSMGTGVLAGVALGLLALNAMVVGSQPRYRWGRLTDTGGVGWGNVNVELKGDDGRVVSSYHTDGSGRYTLHAEPGEYRLVVDENGRSLHEEPVTIRQRPTYLGFKLKLSRL